MPARTIVHVAPHAAQRSFTVASICLYAATALPLPSHTSTLPAAFAVDAMNPIPLPLR